MWWHQERADEKSNMISYYYYYYYFSPPHVHCKTSWLWGCLYSLPQQHLLRREIRKRERERKGSGIRDGSELERVLDRVRGRGRNAVGILAEHRVQHPMHHRRFPHPRARPLRQGRDPLPLILFPSSLNHFNLEVHFSFSLPFSFSLGFCFNLRVLCRFYVIFATLVLLISVC